MTQESLSHRSSLSEWACVVLVFALAMGVYVVNATAGFTGLPGELIDTRFNNVVLEHAFQWATGQVADFWSPEYFYPFSGALAWSDPFIGNSFIYALFRGVGVDRETAYVAWYFSAFALTYAASLYAFRKLGLSLAAAALGALVFTFAAPVVIKVYHAQLVWRFASPLAFLFAVKFLETARLRDLGLFVLFVAWQFLCSFYLGAFLTLFLGCCFLAVLIASTARQQLFSLFGRLLSARRGPSDLAAMVAGFAMAGLAAYALLHQLSVAASYDFTERNVLATIVVGLPDASSYLMADTSKFYAWLGAGVDTPLRHEKQMFVGFGALVLILASVFFVRGSAHLKTVWAISGFGLIFLILLTLRIGESFSLYWPIAMAPGFSAIRAPGRIAEIMMLPVAFMAAVGFAGICRQIGTALSGAAAIRGPAVALAGTIIFGFLIAELNAQRIATIPAAAVHARQASIAAMLPGDLPEDAILALRRVPSDTYELAEVDAMILAQTAGRPTMNGYSGNFPPAFRSMETCDDIQLRLSGYTLREKLSPEAAQALFDRVVPVGFPENCGSRPDRPQAYRFASAADLASETPVPFEVMPLLELEVRDARIADGGRIEVVLRVNNKSTVDVNPNFAATRQVIRFSWRFEPDGANWPPEPHWDTRVELTVPIKAGAFADQTLSIPPPPAPGAYNLQLTMMQEFVAWFHLHGLKIATVDKSLVREDTGVMRLMARGAAAPQAPQKLAFATGSGWSSQEDWGLWSLDGASRLTVGPVVGDRPARLEIQMRVFTGSSAAPRPQSLEIRAGSASLVSRTFEVGPGDAVYLVQFDVPASAWAADGRLELDLLHPAAVSPKEIGMNTDDRKLSIGLIGVSAAQ